MKSTGNLEYRYPHSVYTAVLTSNVVLLQEREVAVRQMQGQLEGQEGVHGSELLDMQRKMHDIQRKYKAMQVQPHSSAQQIILWIQNNNTPSSLGLPMSTSCRRI